METFDLKGEVVEFVGTLFLEKPRKYVVKFFKEMILGILGNRSPLVSNISRFLYENKKLKHTEKRLCNNLGSENIEWEEAKIRQLELASRIVEKDDVIAFDPGDIVKNYAQEMEDLYPVHDGSKNTIGSGYEEFAVEAVQYKNGHQYHIPLYQRICNANRKEYISQNFQIILCIKVIAEYLCGKGIWTFDRGHDRSILFEIIFTTLSRWIVRVCKNRVVLWKDEKIKIDDLIKKMDLSKVSRRITHPKVTGEIFLAWEKITLTIKDKSKEVYFVAAHDKRNENPVLFYTNIEVKTADDAIGVFGYYLCRWGKEEGYRFTKSFLNLEDIRTMSFESIQNLAFLVFLVYFFVTCFYKNNPEKIDQLCEENLKNFKHINEVKFKYYRVGQLMRVLLWRQYNKNLGALMATEVR